MALLASAYRRAVEVADGLGARSIAFPSISTGIYGFPQPLASQTAVVALRSLEPVSVQRCVLVAYDPGTLAVLDEALATLSAPSLTVRPACYYRPRPAS